MEMTTSEMQALKTLPEATDQAGQSVRKLADLELTLVGGGCGDVQF